MTAENGKPIVGYWNYRGSGQPIRHLLAHGEDGLGSEWLEEKSSMDISFPNLPYYIDNDIRLSQSDTILRFLAQKYNLAGETELERLRIDIMDCQIKDYFRQFITIIQSSDDEIKTEYVQLLADHLDTINRFMGVNPFVSGTNVSFVDFCLYEYLIRMPQFAPEVMQQFPDLLDYIKRIESLPNVAHYLENQHKPLPFLISNDCNWNYTY
ncbi:Glutathione S-transferase Mu 3 [Blomia tropicalis]|nr:Glutathione S-transferase Mu 3 [Blomia tropicalis]